MLLKVLDTHHREPSRSSAGSAPYPFSPPRRRMLLLRASPPGRPRAGRCRRRHFSAAAGAPGTCCDSAFPAGRGTRRGCGGLGAPPVPALLPRWGWQRGAPPRRTRPTAAADPRAARAAPTTRRSRTRVSPLAAARRAPLRRRWPRAPRRAAHARGAASMRAGGAPPPPLPSACASRQARCHGQRGGRRAGRCGSAPRSGLARGAG